MHPVITITCAFTRLWAVEQWLKDLASVEHDPALTNLAFIIDADEPAIKSQLTQFAEDRGYRKCLIEMNSDWQPNEVRIAIRRQRIAEVKNQSKRLIAALDGDYIIGLEDDTIFTNLDLNVLLQPLIAHEEVGFVEGVQCGRWGVRMVGVWKVDNWITPNRAKTLLPPPPVPPDTQWGMGNPDYQYIDAGGFYGYATRRILYLNHDYYGSSTQPWGPDVNFGLWVRSVGYTCMVHWPTEFGHDDHGTIAYPRGEKLAQITYTKDNVTGKWERTDAEKN